MTKDLKDYNGEPLVEGFYLQKGRVHPVVFMVKDEGGWKYKSYHNSATRLMAGEAKEFRRMDEIAVCQYIEQERAILEFLEGKLESLTETNTIKSGSTKYLDFYEKATETIKEGSKKRRSTNIEH